MRPVTDLSPLELACLEHKADGEIACYPYLPRPEQLVEGLYAWAADMENVAKSGGNCDVLMDPLSLTFDRHAWRAVRTLLPADLEAVCGEVLRRRREAMVAASVVRA